MLDQQHNLMEAHFGGKIDMTFKTIKPVLLLSAMIAGQAMITTAHAEGDAEVGKKVFKKCASCHMVGEGAKNKVGPYLTGIVGRSAASVEKFKYGKSIVAAGEAGLIWTEEELFDYLKDPKKYLRAKLDDKKAKSKMAFKLKKEKDRLNVIAYLKTITAE